MIQRVNIAVILATAIVVSFASAQSDTRVTAATGIPCRLFDSGIEYFGFTYEIIAYNVYFSKICCAETVQPSINTQAECESFCWSNNWHSLFGSLRDGVYTPCICLAPCLLRSNLDNFISDLINYQENGYYIGRAPSSALQNLATSNSFTRDVEMQDQQYAPISLSPQQTARLRTTATWDNGNSATIHVIPSIQTVTSGTVGFTIRSIADYQVQTFRDIQLRNNSLMVHSNRWDYQPPLQMKRQTPYYWTYYLQNTGSEVVVVLAAGPEIVASWRYSPIVFDTDSSITSKLGSFTFDLDVQFAPILLDRCEDSELYDLFGEKLCSWGFELYYCENGAWLRKLCYLGCNVPSGTSIDCLPCNSTTCQGTCVPTATSERCECSGMRVGAGCQLDLASSSTYLAMGNNGDLKAAIENCELGKNCATFTSGRPQTDYGGGMLTLGGCCTAIFTLTDLTRNFNSTVLLFERASEWECFISPGVEVSREMMNDTYEIYAAHGINDNWGYMSRVARIAPEEYFICDSSVNGTGDPRTVTASAAVRDPVSAVFVGTSGAAVAVGFIVGFIVKPERMALKSKKAKGCLPKGEQSFARSILAIIILDVVLVTVFGIVGLNFPITLLVFISGISVVVFAKLVRMIGRRFETTTLVYRLLIVQHLFGCFAGAFLIVLGLGLFLFSLSMPELYPLASMSASIVPWLFLGTYCFWAFVIVHFATAIPACVSFYFSLVKQQNRKSSSVKKSEKQEHVEMTKQASSNSLDSEQHYHQSHVIVPISEQPYQQQFVVPTTQAMNETESLDSESSPASNQSQSEPSQQKSESISESSESASHSQSVPKETGSSRESVSEQISAPASENSTSSSAESNSSD